MEYPTEDEIQAMTNREFASLMEFQAAMIEQTLKRDDRSIPDAGPDWKNAF
jgi:hypothetical protein